MAQKLKNLVTEQDFQTAYGALIALIKVVIGTETGKTRFRGFKILDNVKKFTNDALEAFKADKLESAMKYLKEANDAIIFTERAYARNAVDKFFMPMILNLGKLDSDLNDAIGKRLREYQEIIGLMGSSQVVDMNEVSRRYWALLDRIESAPIEQRARYANRLRREQENTDRRSRERAAERRLTEEKFAEDARQRKADAEERRRLRLTEQSQDMASQLVGLF